jgi:hypothetical protein
MRQLGGVARDLNSRSLPEPGIDSSTAKNLPPGEGFRAAHATRPAYRRRNLNAFFEGVVFFLSLEHRFARFVAEEERACRAAPMARVQDQSDRNFSARTPDGAGDPESLAHLLDQSEIIPLFDETIRLRFGKLITAAVLKSKRRH